MSRNPPTQDVDDVLIKSRRRCALCYASGDATVKSGNVAHIEPVTDSRDETADNLMFLCAKHIKETHERKAATPMKLRAWRAQLYEAISKEDNTTRTTPPKVFISYGLDTTVIHEIAAVLSDRDVEQIILPKRLDPAFITLERLQLNLSADFAIVVLDKPAKDPAELFELGFFLGRLGPERVCALAMPDTLIPRDISGAHLIKKDASGRWKNSLIRRLAAAAIGTQSPE